MSLALFPTTCDLPTCSRTGHGVFGFPMNTRSDEAGWEGRNQQLGARIGVVWLCPEPWTRQQKIIMR